MMPLGETETNGTISDSGSSDESHQDGTPLQKLPSYRYRPLIDRINDRIQSGKKFFSLEFFPPKTESGAMNLTSRFERMALARPLFCDITWHPAGDPGGDKPSSTMAMANVMLNYCGLDTVMHVTCCRQSKDEIRAHLDRAKEFGLRNLVALRGDPPPGEVEWKAPKDGFAYAVDLVRFIRKTYGDYFVIAVGGYPTGHPDCPTYEQDLLHLKEKIDAGADFIITQLFFEVDVFFQFVRDCREIGITCPIFPGMMPIQAYQQIMNIVRISKLRMPTALIEAMKTFKDNDEAVRRFGIELCTDMCRKILESGLTNGLHFYTLNRDVATVEILRNLGMYKEYPRRSLPWKTSANHMRCREDVRPIFWSTRPQSYIYRTSDWDEFPNGRWGNSASASFSVIGNYYLFYLQSRAPKGDLLKMWGEELTSEKDVWSVFLCYLTGDLNRAGVKVERTPWCDDIISPETNLLLDQLIDVNRHGFLTINSQPRVNAAPSTDPMVGWGNPGGYVFQKAYLEFFTSRENVVSLKEVLASYPNVNYHIVDSKSETDYTNCSVHQPIAVTWGIFPGKEVIQPTVVDPIAFKIWKDEAFELWRQQWGALYAEDSESRRIIDEMIDSYCLVNLVDNDFPQESCLFEIIDKTRQLREASNGELSSAAALAINGQ